MSTPTPQQQQGPTTAPPVASPAASQVASPTAPQPTASYQGASQAAPQTAPQTASQVPAAEPAAPKTYSAERQPGREHVPLYPKNFIILRIVQLCLALIVMGLTGFCLHLLATNGAALSMFVGIATLITTTWILLAHYAMPKLYNYWAVLAMDIFLVVFWLAGFAVLASETSLLMNETQYVYGYGYQRYEWTGLALAFVSCLGAAAGVGGVQFALFVTSLIMHSMALHRHRKAGLHCNPVPGSAATAAPSAPVAGAAAAPVYAANNEKATGQALANPAYPQQAAYSQHQQQQYYNQPQMQQQQSYYAPQGQYSQAQYPQAQYPQGQYQQGQYAQGQYAQYPQQGQQYAQPQYQPTSPAQQQQPYYPPQQSTSPPPLSPQTTDISGTQVSSPANGGIPPVPSHIQEAPTQNYHQQQ